MKVEFTHWIDTDGIYLGYLNDFPDHWTQGEDLDNLIAHLTDLYELFSGVDSIPGIRKVSQFEVA